jgi:hypothetical protein
MRVLRSATLLRLVFALAILALVSGQFFVNLGDKTKGTEVGTPGGAGEDGSAEVAEAAEGGDVAAGGDSQAALQVLHDLCSMNLHWDRGNGFCFCISWNAAAQVGVVHSKL